MFSVNTAPLGQGVQCLPVPDAEMIRREWSSELHRHIRDGYQKQRPGFPKVFIESPLTTGSGAICRWYLCGKQIEWRDGYRVVISPSLPRLGGHWADCFHVVCFEEFADFDDPELICSTILVTRTTFTMRIIRDNIPAHSGYWLDGGAERLVAEWKLRMYRMAVDRGQVAAVAVDPGVKNLFYDAGSAKFVPQRLGPQDSIEVQLLSHQLAPNESDGPGDAYEWNLFACYLQHERVIHKHHLSNMLLRWKYHMCLAHRPDGGLDDADLQAKGTLSVKAIRAIKRLAVVPMATVTHPALGFIDLGVLGGEIEQPQIL